jgi:N-acetyl-1-D-myo-inositol-2-amino-2-deoxy-alpha-D-glucopyranoside deacetylase
MNHSNPHTLLAVHAHPDDESFSTGGTLAKYAALGIRTVLVFCTRGEVGEIQDPAFVPPAPDMTMEDIRNIELEKALKVLQVDSVHFLGYRDSGMEGSADNSHPRAFARADLNEATAKLVWIIRHIRPQVIVTYNEKGTYGHPDHMMAHKVTLRAFEAAGDPTFNSSDDLPPWPGRKLYYTAIPLSRLHLMVQMARERGEEPEFDPESLGTPDERITTAVDVRAFLNQKFEALFSHRSQIGPRSFFRRIPEEWKDEAFGFEYFECVKGCTSEKETDLFHGL